MILSFFFFNDTATTEIYTLSLHDALPIYRPVQGRAELRQLPVPPRVGRRFGRVGDPTRLRERRRPGDAPRVQADRHVGRARSEEHTSELQSRQYLVCRLLLEKKKKINTRD